MPQTLLVPPDGGYGWIIVVASALNNFLIVPLIQNFGMIFNDTFKEMGLSATQGSFIITINSAFGMLTGLINGCLLNHFGYRKVSLVGAFLLFAGVVLTSFADSFGAFLITYGLIASLGNGFNNSAYTLAINTYFEENKSKAIGLSMTLTALGPIIMPQVINLLMKYYTIEGVTLILGGIIANGFIAAVLLQPVKWHANRIVVKDEDIITGEDEDEDHAEEAKDEIGPEPDNMNKIPLVRSVSQVEAARKFYRFHRKDSIIPINYEQEAAGIMGIDSILGSMMSLESVGLKRIPTAVSTISSRNKTKTQWWRSDSTVNLDSSYNLFDEKNEKPGEGNQKQGEDQVEEKPNSKPEKPFWKRVCLWLVEFFDLKLLKDPIYVNIMMGMSLAVFAELNFSVLTPFILNDFGLNTSQIATFLSCLGVADIVFRFLAPYIGSCLKLPARHMYLLTLVALMLTRFALIIFSHSNYLLVIAAGLGCAKGVRAVFMSLVIPTYVPLQRLASASGIQMMANGLCILTGGPILGFVRDITGSYKACIIIMNCVTFVTVIMWTAEILVQRCKAKNNIDAK